MAPSTVGAARAPTHLPDVDEAASWLAACAGPDAMARIRAHPGLREAMRAAADGVVTLHDHNPLLNRILNDRGRTVFGFFVLYLDATADAGGMGLTTARMVALCQETGLCSRGRAKALLALMRWGGYLEPAAPRGDRRARPLAPTDRMRQLFQLRWRAQFSALRALGGAAEESLALLDEPEFFTRLAVCFGSVYRAGFRLLDHAPKLATICEHDGGMLVVFALVGAARSSGRAPTVTGLARRFSLSRTHALQILRHAEGIGLVVRAGMLEDGVPVDAGPGFALTAEGHAAVEDFVVAMFTLFECCARWALHAHRAARAA